MGADIRSEINHDTLRSHFNIYTRKAFNRLPPLKKPHILDIGCGTGVPTLELARLCDGDIIGVDIDQQSLDRLTAKIAQAGLTDRVKTLHCSMENMKFPDEQFDIIWAEGVIAHIGFQKGLIAWCRFIKPNGFLVVHDNIDNLTEKRTYIAQCGYRLIDSFIVPKDVWWNEYYCILEKQIKKLRKKYHTNLEAHALLDKEQHGVNEFKSNPAYHGSVFFIMQKSIDH
jgi:ubiquinone/menaquinone biosynthesis C-methylase UbiE